MWRSQTGALGLSTREVSSWRAGEDINRSVVHGAIGRNIILPLVCLDGQSYNLVQMKRGPVKHSTSYAEYSNGWQVQWQHPRSTGTRVIARRPRSYWKSARKWHLVATGRLREIGINTPRYRADSWEIDWSKRDGKLAWGRNPESKIASAREWHWIDHSTLDRAGIAWKPKTRGNGRYLNGGYVLLTRRGMTEADIKIAEEFDLFRGKNKGFLREHHLVAAKKFRVRLTGKVVRHFNGVKSDNGEENLLLGTTQENTADHNTARLMAMYWHNKYDALLADRASHES